MKKILKSKIVIASAIFLLLDLAGGFLILAPFLISVGNIYERSALSEQFWPILSPSILIDLLVNHPQAVATSAIAAFTIYLLYVTLRTFFAGGIYRIVMDGAWFMNDGAGKRSGFQEFLSRASQSWAGFAKIAIAAIVVYTIAGFLGFTVGRVFAGLGLFWMIIFFLFVMLIASTYLQILRIRVISSGDNSVVKSMKETRQIISKSISRLILGNLSVVVVGALICAGLWLIVGSIRGGQWSLARGAITVVLEQLIVLVICFMQAIRINFNYSIVKKGEQDALGRTELGGV